MTNDNYVLNEHGAWGNPSEAVRWYRAEVNRLREALAEQTAQQQDPVAWLSRDDARLALWDAINKREFGNPTDDKLILDHLRKNGLWIGKYTSLQPAPVAKPHEQQDYWQEEARRYAQNADFWRGKYESATAQQQELAGKWAGGWVVVHGDPIDGLQFTGPFSNADDAHNWAAKHLGTDWWISPMETWSWDK